jgi:hypothetical protein
MMSPILSDIDKLGRSYLSTWTDTGMDKAKINTSHPPGIGFWYSQQFDPLDKKDADTYAKGLKAKHEAQGINGRNYETVERTAEEISSKLYGGIEALTRRLGPKGTRGYDFVERPHAPFAVMPEHYETKWTGIMMVRDPEKVKERYANPSAYGVKK